MKKILLLTMLVLVISGTVFGGTSSMQLKIGSNMLTVDNRQIKLSQPVTSNGSGVMVPIDILTKGFGASVSKKGDEITITPKEAPEVEFITDSDKGFSKLLSMFDNAKTSIYVSMYSLTNDKLVDKMISDKYPNRQVWIILDKRENNGSADYKRLLNKKNVFVKLISKNVKDYKYHKKIAIFDGKEIFTGSSNWSYLAFSTNDEQNFVIKSKDVAAQAIRTFQAEWKSIK